MLHCSVVSTTSVVRLSIRFILYCPSAVSPVALALASRGAAHSGDTGAESTPNAALDDARAQRGPGLRPDREPRWDVVNAFLCCGSAAPPLSTVVVIWTTVTVFSSRFNS